MKRFLFLLFVLFFANPPVFANPSFNDMFDQHGSIMLLIDPRTGSIVDANKAASVFYGYPLHQMRSMRIQDINTLTPAQVKAERELAAQESRNYFVFRHRIANGDIKTVEVFSNPLVFSGRKLLHSIIVDISEKRLLEEAIFHQQSQLEQTIADQTEVIAQDYKKRLWMLVITLVLVMCALIYVVIVRRKEQHLSQKLSNQKQRLANVITATRAGTWELNLQSGELYVNEMWAELVGFSLDELLPMSVRKWNRFIHPDDLAVSKKAINDHLDGKLDFYTCELRVKQKNGDWRWVLDRGQVTKYSASGEPLIVSGTRQDISERKLAEEQIISSHNQYIGLTANIPDGTYSVTFDEEGVTSFDYVSPRFCELLQVEASDILADSQIAFSKVHPEDLEGLMKANIRARDYAETFRWEGRFIINNETRWMRIASNPINVQKENPVWVGIMSDITEAKNTALSLNLASNVYRNAREGMMITGLDNRITDVNAAFTEITGYERGEVIGKDPTILSSGRHSGDFFNNMWNDIQNEHYWSGEFWNRRKSGEFYIQRTSISAIIDDKNEVREYLCIFSDVTLERSHESELERIAHYDSLTNLPNRLLLSDRLNQAMKQSKRHHQSVAVLYIDLDRFKEVNDTFGHDIGDNLLVQVSEAMEQCLREGDTLARIGGDEFVAVLPDGDGKIGYVNVIERLLSAATSPITINDVEICITASIGVSIYPQMEVIEADQLLRQADQAMYQAKLRGKNRVHFFDEKEEKAVRHHHAGTERIQQALNNGEFELYYQPKVDMQKGRVIGMEALLRWNHPVLGTVAPDLFLPAIESHEMINDVGDWVINEALHQMQQWHEAGYALNVSVNIAAKQLQNPLFVDCLRQHLNQSSNYTSGDLTLEILEDTAIDDLEQVAKVISDCMNAGVKISLDDFGTGYSSLTYLSKLHVNELKIDRSFVKDMMTNQDNLQILEGVIALAKTFDIPVIAEGVESLGHGEVLLKLGCIYAQGYAISRPMPAAEVARWIDNWQKPDNWKIASL
ncbi:GGDEF and EAL domain-containing protein [Neptuniibacter sp.]|uniref:GGDEF and EAL domain-containing protein n=1 Tax=Neptuniibacter sp. TaxID=1962643 RepID=UPI002619B9BA|nr:GGDEF and EAL domain-containing protein [Neptuniibacter sp.]MCP4595095.1 EAL domain-containing protein [Neptuniibacter sp.]